MAKHFPRKYEELSLDSWNSQKKKKGGHGGMLL